MRIGVMTFWWSEDNYGQLLQCYALQKYLRDLGHDAFLIRYRMLETGVIGLREKLIKYGLHPWRMLDGFHRIASRQKGRMDLAAHSRHFDEFRDLHLKVSDGLYHSLAELRDNPPAADLYIVGSDQVWRFDESFRDDDIHAMMLDFGPLSTKRVSYAASFGREKNLPRTIRLVPSLMRRLDSVSVREQEGIGLCRALGRTDARVVCDPTILLKAADYMEFAESPRVRRKYVFCYMLKNNCGFNYPSLKQWADDKGLDLVYVTGNALGDSSYGDENAARLYLTIPQWLGRLAQAEYVVTNSFHCCVFATHFGRKLGVVELRGEARDMNSRLSTLETLRTSPITMIDGRDFSNLERTSESHFKEDGCEAGIAFLRYVLGEDDR